MSADESVMRRSLLADVISELERGGAGRPVEIARRLGPDWTELDVLVALAELLRDGVVAYDRARSLLVGDMTGMGQDQLKRAIDACRRAGLPVVDEADCTCGLRGRLVVLARSDGLRVLWPYDQRCPIHGSRDREGPPPPTRRRQRRSRSQAAIDPWATRKAGGR